MTKPGSALLASLCLLTTQPAPAGELQQDLLSTIKGFYTWALTHNEPVYALAPAIKNHENSSRFYLDTTQLAAFTEQFMASGYFSSQFPAAVTQYYRNYETEFATYTQETFDQMAADGRGPLLEVEDMDIFFCAQEYDWTPDFIDNTRLVKTSVQGDNATAIVESTYQWQTTFHFHQEKGHWLISGYCVFE